MRPSNATTPSAAPSSQYEGDDERSESEYTSCAPGPIARNSSAESENESYYYMKWIVGHFDVMETLLSKMQSDVEEVKHDFITNGGTSPLNEIRCQAIRFQLDKIRAPFGVIEQYVSAWKQFSEENPLGRM